MNATDIAVLSAGAALAGVLLSSLVQVVAQRLQWGRDDRVRRRVEFRNAVIALAEAAASADHFMMHVATLHIGGTQHQMNAAVTSEYRQVIGDVQAAADAYTLTATPQLATAAADMMRTGDALLGAFERVTAGETVDADEWHAAAAQWRQGRREFLDLSRSALYGKLEHRL